MSNLNKAFVLPKYKDDCFSNIPSTIFELFNIPTKKPTLPKKYWQKYAGKFRNIVIFLIDSLGFWQWQEFANSFSLFKTLYEKKLVFPITSVFPSTTSAAITTLHSGLTPAEHGLFEWILYFSEINKAIVTLPFCNLYYLKRDSLLAENVNPKILFSGKTIYGRLKKYGVNSFLFFNQEYAKSAYSSLISQEANVISFSGLNDLLEKLKNQLLNSGRNYYSIYWDNYDVLCHTFGPYSQEAKKELEKISEGFIGFLGKLDKKTKKETLIILTADHGQIALNPEGTLYLDEDKILMKSLVKNKNGEVILPTGSARDIFLHVEKSKVEAVYRYLSKKIKEKAVVLKVNEAIRLNLFGTKKIKEIFRVRLGDLLILPYKDYTIWRKYQDEKFKLLGGHGGLSKEEVIIPLSIFNPEEI